MPGGPQPGQAWARAGAALLRTSRRNPAPSSAPSAPSSIAPSAGVATGVPSSSVCDASVACAGRAAWRASPVARRRPGHRGTPARAPSLSFPPNPRACVGRHAHWLASAARLSPGRVWGAWRRRWAGRGQCPALPVGVGSFPPPPERTPPTGHALTRLSKSRPSPAPPALALEEALVLYRMGYTLRLSGICWAPTASGLMQRSQGRIPAKGATPWRLSTPSLPTS